MLTVIDNMIIRVIRPFVTGAQSTILGNISHNLLHDSSVTYSSSLLLTLSNTLENTVTAITSSVTKVNDGLTVSKFALAKVVNVWQW